MKYFLIITFLLSLTFAQHHCNKQYGRHCNHYTHDNDYVDATGPGDKKVTIIKVVDTTSYNGETKFYHENLDECLSDIPDVSSVAADYSAKNTYMKGINQKRGEPRVDDWVREFTATVEIHYMLRQTSLVIATTRSIEGTPPVFKELGKNRRTFQRFTSHPENGDSYGGRSKRRYFHSTKESALKDAQRQAKNWLSQQEAVMCDNIIQTTQR